MYDWYGKNWLKLKKQCIALVISIWCVAEESETQFSNSEQIKLVSAEVMTAIVKRSKADTLGMWNEALPLFAEFEEFLIKYVQGRTEKGISESQMLGQALKFYLEDSRRMLLAAELGETPSKVKTWERVQRLSNKIKSKRASNSVCCEEHFETLLHYIKENHNGDYNYPQTLKNIRTYFFKHSAACKDLVAFDEDMDTYSDANFLAPYVNSEELGKCIRQLDSREVQVLDIEFNLGVCRTRYINKAAYLQQISISKKEYEQLRNQGLRKLLRIFENSLSTVINNAN